MLATECTTSTTGSCASRVGIDDGKIENALGLHIHPARQIEPRQFDPRRRPMFGIGRRRRREQRILPRDEPPFLVFAPVADVENRPRRGRRAIDPPPSTDDSVRPPGRLRMILSGVIWTVMSSEFGRMATP